MTKFEEKQNKVLSFVNAHFPEDNPFLENDVTLSDINALLKSTIARPLYYIDEYSNDVEKSKYKLHSDYVDFLSQMMELIIGEFSIAFSEVSPKNIIHEEHNFFHSRRPHRIHPKNEIDEDDKNIRELYKKYPRTIPTQKDITLHTVIKTEIDEYFYDDKYQAGEVVYAFTTGQCYSQIALIKLVLRYAGFFERINVFGRILSAVKVVLTTPMVYEHSVAAVPKHIKDQIEKFFGWMVTDEVRKKYKEAAKERNKEKKDHTFNFKLYNVTINSSAVIGASLNSILIAATSMQDAYDTFVKNYMNEQQDPKMLIDGIVKVSEHLGFSDEVYDFIEEKIINEPPVEYVKLRGPFSFLHEMFDNIDMNKENEDFEK